jgi:hypothetical protein
MRYFSTGLKGFGDIIRHSSLKQIDETYFAVEYGEANE